MSKELLFDIWYQFTEFDVMPSRDQTKLLKRSHPDEAAVFEAHRLSTYAANAAMLEVKRCWEELCGDEWIRVEKRTIDEEQQ